jgi:hypothetical protein
MVAEKKPEKGNERSRASSSSSSPTSLCINRAVRALYLDHLCCVRVY